MGEPYEVVVVMGDREKMYPQLTPHPCLRVYRCYADSLERAILLGFSVSEGDRLLVMDADGSHPAEMVPLMLHSLEGYELVAGSRFMRGSRFQQSLFRRVVSAFFTACARLRGSRLSDPMTGFFAVRREVLNRVAFKPFKWKTCLEVELKARPLSASLPIHFGRRVSGASKTTLKTGLKLIYDLVMA
jgi:dolichol-phosphate mannosyltransferase